MISPEEFQAAARRILEQVGTVIVGQEAVIRGVLIAMVGGGHVLLEGVPGLGKTSLVRAYAAALNLQFGRIQFTPDLMPADITGTSIVSEDELGRRSLTFQRGPVFANLVLADEINRATPKTQSALLEAMQERTVTAGTTSHPLPDPFFVLATQNPIEMEGTYPLPEAQLDRFFFKLLVTYPFRGELATIVKRTAGSDGATAHSVAGADTLVAMTRLVQEVPMAAHVLDYAVRIVLATQPNLRDSPEVTRRYVRIGASPRGAQAIALAGRINSLLDGRYNLSYEDVRSAVHPALRHRISLNFEADTRGLSADEVLDEIVRSVPEVPN
jgi:MoxR-like ATPase